MTPRRVPLPRRPQVSISSVGFGAASLGNLYHAISDEQAQHTCAAVAAAGITYVDTAPHYGLGLSEERVGTWVRETPDVMISTKVGRVLEPLDAPWSRDTEGFDVPARYRRVRDYSAAGIRRSLEDSLVRLGVDHVQVALLHDPDEVWEQAVEQSIPELVRLRDEGLVDAIGVGMNQSEMLTEFVRRCDVDVVMCAGRFTLLDQSAAADLLPIALQREVAVLAAGVFNSGILTQPEPPDDATYDYEPADRGIIDRARRLASVCREHGVTLPAAAVQFPLLHPAVASVVLGMQSPQEVAADAAAAGSAIPPELWQQLVREGLLSEAVAEALV